MLKRKDELPVDRILDFLGRHWKWLVVLMWLVFCVWFLVNQWSDVRSFNLGDTDDNMRIAQVRALLHGQDWFDLRDYRLNPPFGANIHWSHLVDLPIAAIILVLRPFIGNPQAELVAVAIEPLIPLLLLFYGIALTARRLIDERSFLLPIFAMSVAGTTNSMFSPERIDHHNWQLALLAMSIAGLADPKRLRGGIVLGVTTALSMAIGLELLIYLAIAGSAVVLFWVADIGERRRLIGYSVSLCGSVAFCFLGFASYANRLAVCDALSPVWLSDAMLGCAILFAMAVYSPRDWRVRLGVAFAAAVVIGAFHALTWPQCLGRPDQVSPEVYDLWMSHVREARPVYLHGWRVATMILGLPVTGTVGWLVLAWRNRRDPNLLLRSLACALPAIAAMLLLFWQTRTAPAAQMMGAVGAAAFVWILLPVFDRSRNAAVRTLGVAAVAVVGLGALVPLVMNFIPAGPASQSEVAVGTANRMCNLIYSFRPIALLPKGKVFTFLDTAPRLIAVTHHDSIMGPYHRNGEQIADVMKAFRGDAAQAHSIIVDKYHSDYLLTCPNSSTTTIFLSETPKGFYAQLAHGQTPPWLKPIDLGANNPFRMWRVVPSAG